MSQNQWSDIEQSMKTLAEESTGILSWTWEERFGAALAQFSAANTDSTLNLLNPHFSKTWDSTNIKEAPARTAKICLNYGGLRPGQLLLTTDPEHEILLLVAWWPWGNNETISIRVIPDLQNLSDEDSQKFLEMFRNVFGV